MPNFGYYVFLQRGLAVYGYFMFPVCNVRYQLELSALKPSSGLSLICSVFPVRNFCLKKFPTPTLKSVLPLRGNFPQVCRRNGATWEMLWEGSHI